MFQTAVCSEMLFVCEIITFKPSQLLNTVADLGFITVHSLVYTIIPTLFSILFNKCKELCRIIPNDIVLYCSNTCCAASVL